MANTLFIFLNEPTAFKQALSVIMDDQGSEIAPYQDRTLEELQSLNKNTSLTIVLPCNKVLCQVVELPTLKNASLMLPNILEESLITSIEQMHFVLDKAAIAEKQYRAYYIDKAFLTELLETLAQAKLTVNKITSDLLNTNSNSCLIGPDFIQFNHPGLLMGAINEAGLEPLEFTHLNELEKITFENSKAKLNQWLDLQKERKLSTAYQSYVASHLAQFGCINLLAGAFEIKKKHVKNQYFFSIPLLSFACLFYLFTNVAQYKTLNQNVKELKQDNFKYYQRVFPEAKQMISPRFRVEQWLKTNQSNKQTPILSLLQLSAPVLNQNTDIKILSMQAQREQLTLNFQLSNFDDLNKIKTQLEQTGVNVDQINANTENHIVNAIWKLTL